MGKKSIKENKNIYQECRECKDWSREKACEELGCISQSNLVKIENSTRTPEPEEVLAMARAYGNHSLCNYYCSNECPIGQINVPEIKSKEISQITLQMLSTLNSLNKEKDRLIDILCDGEISVDEVDDFIRIKEHFDEMTSSIEAFKLWLNETIDSGKIDKAILVDKLNK